MKNTKPTIAITGAGGFVGTVLTDYFLNKGWKVVALVRKPGNKNLENLEYRSYDITRPLPITTLSGVNYLIHAAYIKLDKTHPDAVKANIEGAKFLLNAAIKAKISRMIFVSTMSAHEDAISAYGKQKLAIEELFLKSKNTTVLRSGLIIGNGGIVREMAQFMKSKHAVPLIGGGKQPLQIISVYDLAKVIDNVIGKSLDGRYVAATPEVYTYKSFYAALAKYINVKIVYIPLPYWFLETVLKIAARIGLSLGVGDDNLKGLKKLINMPSSKDMKTIGVNLLNLDEALSKSNING